jgi:glutamine phosphoribosylpyrophosphate amidotransferase
MMQSYASAAKLQGGGPILNRGTEAMSDLCLVHNGSLSNHNRLRQTLRREGIRFATDNDTEVAAGYLTWRLRQGMSLTEALEAALSDLDGFHTFAVGTWDGFAILRDPIACKPAVLAETNDWVAMATEYRREVDSGWVSL